MSQIMWSRLFRLKIPIPPDISKKDVDKAFEDETHKDCDEAAKVLNDKDFRDAMQRAFQKLREKKKVPIELAA